MLLLVAMLPSDDVLLDDNCRYSSTGATPVRVVLCLDLCTFSPPSWHLWQTQSLTSVCMNRADRQSSATIGSYYRQSDATDRLRGLSEKPKVGRLFVCSSWHSLETATCMLQTESNVWNVSLGTAIFLSRAKYKVYK